MAKQPEIPPIGELLRRQRVEVLRLGLRETARRLGIAAPHLTDIEKGRRSPSEDLLHRIQGVYGIDEAMLRAGWSKAAAIVGEVATQDPVTAQKVPELLRSARKLSAEQWDKLIETARGMATGQSQKGRRK